MNNPFQSNSSSQKRKNLNFSVNPNISQSNEEMKKELQIENEIRDHLKCYICLTKVVRPKMCRFCKKICCKACIDKWLIENNYCGICKHTVSSEDMIELPFLDDMSTFFIKNIDSHPKINPNINKQKNPNQGKEEINNIINENSVNIMKEKEINKDMCPKHKSKLDYYCVQCDNYFCSNCLVFFNDEGKKHINHLVIQIQKMNDLGIKEAINEYKKLPKTKKTIEHLIGLINVKLKENEIKKAEFKNYFDLIKKLYFEKIDETSNDLKAILNELKSQKNTIENCINSVPNGFNNIVNNNDHVQGYIVSQDLKKYNRLNKDLEDDIKEKSKISPKLFFENYETEIMEIDVPYGGQYNEGLEIANYKINIIPGFPSRLILKYLQGQVYISFCVDIDLPLNAINYPRFYSYITIKNKKYGLEFINLANQSFPQNYFQKEKGDSKKRLRQQISSTQFESQQFLFLAGEEKKFRMRLYIMKAYYQ